MGSHLRLEPVASSIIQGATVCADGEMLPGIDVSKWQGEINWSQVADDGIAFAFIRVSDGLGYDDAYFVPNWQGAQANGIARGAYQFFRSDEDPVAQADYLLETMGGLDPGDLPPVIDVETTDGQTPATIAANVGAWIDRVQGALGVEPIIYTGRFFWQDNVATDAFADYPLWIPHWGAACPNLPLQWSDWTVWQDSASGSVAGVSGDVDTNWLNGGAATLAALGAGQPVCGDGFCTGDEDHGTCPGDCPICEEVPPAGRIIDETDLCFFAGGAPEYIRVVNDAGFGGSLEWTRTWVTTTVGNYGLWTLTFAEEGLYRVEAYTDSAYTEWTQTPYQLHADGVTEVVVVDQTAVHGWSEVGDFHFAAGAGQWIRIDDAVSDSAQAGLQIVFDAVRLTRLDGPPPPDGVGTEDGGSGGDSDTIGGDAASGGDLGSSSGGDGELGSPPVGCQCRASPGSRPSVLIAIGLLLVGLARRSRRPHVRPTPFSPFSRCRRRSHLRRPGFNLP